MNSLMSQSSISSEDISHDVNMKIAYKLYINALSQDESLSQSSISSEDISHTMF